MENGCRVFHEFSAFENFILMTRRDAWLIGEIYRAIDPPEDFVRHFPKVVKMTHLDRPVSAWQILRRESVKPMRNLGMFLFAAGLILYVVVSS